MHEGMIGDSECFEGGERCGVWSADVGDEPLYRTPLVRNGVSKVD